MKQQDRSLDYLKQWESILSGAGLTQAATRELIQAIRGEIEPMRSRISGMENQINEMIRTVQHQMNLHKRETEVALLNTTPFRLFVELKNDVRKLQGFQETPFGYEESREQIVPDNVLKANLE